MAGLIFDKKNKTPISETGGGKAAYKDIIENYPISSWGRSEVFLFSELNKKNRHQQKNEQKGSAI